MIVTDRFVFLHLHKSGGSFVNRFLMACVPGSQPVGYHLPRDDIPADARHLPILGTVRNPWDYYVSWYTFQAAMPTPNALFLVASEDRRLDFNGTIRNLLRLGEDASLLSAWVDRLPSERPGRGINLSKACVAPLAQSGMGFYTFLYRRMYGDRSNTTLLDMATLRAGLLDYLPRAGISVSHAIQNWLHATPAVNTSTHASRAELYDDGLRAVVASKDAEIIRRHDFRFGTSL